MGYAPWRCVFVLSMYSDVDNKRADMSPSDGLMNQVDE